MRKTLPISLGFFALFLLGLFSLNQNNNIDTLKKRHAYFLEHNPFDKSLEQINNKRLSNGFPPNKYLEREYFLEMNPALGYPTPGKLFELQKKLIASRKNQAKVQRAPGDAIDNAWVERGPNNIGGRTRAILFDPNDATHKRVFAGGVSGGLWVNNDITSSASSWTRISGITENIAVSAFTVDPNNSNIIYVATGETYTGGDVTGNGVWKSIDGGVNWTHVFGGSTGVTTINSTNGQTFVHGQFNVNDIKAWNNGGSTVVFAAVGANPFQFTGIDPTFIGAFEYGLYKSTDGGANWSLISNDVPSTTHPYEINDIEIAANNSIWVSTRNNVFGSGGGTILTSTDGTTFNLKYNIANGRRTQIAVSSTNVGTFYVLAQVGSSITPVTILKTTDSFANVSVITPPSDADTDISAKDFTRGQAFYDLLLEVNPLNDAIAYVGGIDLFRTANSGNSWSQISKWSNNNALSGLSISKVHADMHTLVFNPGSPNKAAIGNDGGVYYAQTLSGASISKTAISERNNNYNVTQFYKGAIGQSVSSEMLLGGAQDNGSLFKSSAVPGINSFSDISGGDGAYEFIDKDNKYFIVSYVYNSYTLDKIPFGSGTISIQADQNTGAFINPADLDDNLDILFSDGNVPKTNTSPEIHQIARYTNILTSPVRANLKNGLLTEQPTAFKVSPYTTLSTTLFAGLKNGVLLKIKNANTSPQWFDISGPNFLGSISDINFGDNKDEIIVTFHNYGVISVWFTIDRGVTWANKEGDLPDLPVKAVMMNPLNSNEVILGTDLGVWRTDNFRSASPNWYQSQNGMQNSKVTSFDLRTADNTVLASTYGRGLFTGTFTTGTLAIDNFYLSNKKMMIFPTVSDGNITIASRVDARNARLIAYDVNGRQVYNRPLSLVNGGETSINLSLKSGIYLLSINADSFKSTHKIIIK